MKLNVDGGELFYEVIGQGRPILVMHGGLGFDHTAFLPMAHRLKDAAQWILYDHRGNGRSSREAPESWNLARWAKDAEALRAHLGHEKVGVLGHSFGGFIAQRFALDQPDRVDPLMLVGAAGSFGHQAAMVANAQRKGTPEQVKALLGAFGAPPRTDEEFARLWRGVMPLYFFKWEEKYALAFEPMVPSAAAFVRSGMEMGTINLFPELAKLRARTLVLAGADDYIMPLQEAAEPLVKAIPGAELHVFGRSGHYPFVEEPDEFERILRTWLSRQRP